MSKSPTGRQAWKIGLAAIPDAERARNVILSDVEVRAIVAAAYKDSVEFGEFVEVIAVTGARPSQAARLESEDVQANRRDTRVMMPSSKKGKGVKQIVRRPVPVPADLAERLTGRTGRLLSMPSGKPWGQSTHTRRFNEAVKTAEVTPKLDPTVVSIYALRHSSMVRLLKAGVPIRVVASLHDTSVAMIERNYSEHIADYTDDLTRGSLLQTSGVVPQTSGVVPRRAAKVVPIKSAQRAAISRRMRS
jgi:integrase